MSQYYSQSFDKNALGGLDVDTPIYGEFNCTSPKALLRLLKRNALHAAVIDSDLDLLFAEIKSGNFDVNAQDMHGNTPLHLAIVNRHAFPEIYDNIIALLKKNGALYTVQNQYAQTPESLLKMADPDAEELAIMFDSPISKDELN